MMYSFFGACKVKSKTPERWLTYVLDYIRVTKDEDMYKLLFMANYIDYSDYEFRDENQVEGYCWCYRDLFELKTKESQEIVNIQLIEFLDEWRQDAEDMALSLVMKGAVGMKGRVCTYNVVVDEE